MGASGGTFRTGGRGTRGSEWLPDIGLPLMAAQGHDGPRRLKRGRHLNMTMGIASAIAAALVVCAFGGCGTTTDRRAVPAGPSAQVLQPASAEVESLVQQALQDRLTAQQLPDIKLLGSGPRIAIRDEIPSAALRLSLGALPKREGYEFYLISPSAAQSEANRTRMPVHFIAVDRPEISGDTATLWLGVDVVFPADPTLVKMCCCRGKAELHRAGNRWTFVKWVEYLCS